MDEIFETLLARVDENGETFTDGSDVDRWAMGLGLTVSEFFDQIGAALAVKYNAGFANFEFCDSLVNHLWSDLINRVGMSNEIPWPELFDEVFLAFDAGEYYRSIDKTDDPVADFTVPLVDKIVAKLLAASMQ
ncbi:hypothetical protein [Sandarakinorhabdus sp.]|uniref:hypothetical protein n=1 Tax=Sandarakinorhabdus sp. TaxID=1916663 RepID=UPI00333F9DFD